MRERVRRLAYWAPLLYVPVFLGWYAWLEARPAGGEIIVASPLDSHIPFNEWFILGYAAWFPYLIGFIAWLYVVDFRRQVEIPRLAFFLVIGLTVCELGYTLWSTSTGDLRPHPYPRTNWATAVVASLQEFDTPTNVFPSMHVYSSVVVAYSVWVSEYLRSHPWVKWVSLVLCVVISWSTVALKQHSILDAIGALALFGGLWLGWQLVSVLASRRATTHSPELASVTAS